MSKQAVKEWPEIELWRDPLRPDLGPRFGLDFESPTEGFPELMRYIPQQRVNALVEALGHHPAQRRPPVKERAVKEPDGLEQLAAEQGPRWPSRKAAWLDGFREGAQHARMTGAPQQRVNALVEALGHHPAQRRLPVSEQAMKEWPTVKLARGGSGHLYLPAPSMRVRGESETYVPQQRVNALVEALEFYADYERNYLDDQPGEPVGLDRDPESGMWEMDDYAPDQGKRARTALANYKEGEA